MENIEIGLFQLENLIITRSPFLFFNLANRALNSGDGKLNSYVQLALLIHVDRLSQYLEEQKVDVNYPLVLLCEDGAQSRQCARVLEKSGYNNVYVVEGGFSGLLKEALV